MVWSGNFYLDTGKIKLVLFVVIYR